MSGEGRCGITRFVKSAGGSGPCRSGDMLGIGDCRELCDGLVAGAWAISGSCCCFAWVEQLRGKAGICTLCTEESALICYRFVREPSLMRACVYVIHFFASCWKPGLDTNCPKLRFYRPRVTWPLWKAWLVSCVTLHAVCLVTQNMHMMVVT